MGSNICFDPLCGEIYPFVKYLPDRDNQSVSSLDNSLRKIEKDKLSY